MAEKEFTVEISEDAANYLQRFDIDIDTRLSVIDRLFYNHKDDEDTSLFDSSAYKKYTKELEELRFQYNIAKNEFTEKLMPIVAEKVGVPVEEVKFNWRIDDFLANEAIITIID
jgi:hypothetical protein